MKFISALGGFLAITAMTVVAGDNASPSLRALQQKQDTEEQPTIYVLEQQGGGGGGNGNTDSGGNGGVSSMNAIATVKGMTQDGTLIYMILLGDSEEAAKDRGNSELAKLNAKPIESKGRHKGRELYNTIGFKLNDGEVHDFTPRGAQVDKAMKMWNDVETSSFVYTRTTANSGIIPGTACTRNQRDNVKTFSDGDLGGVKRGSITLGVCCISGTTDGDGFLDGDVDIIMNNHRDLTSSSWWDKDIGDVDRYTVVAGHEYGHMLGLDHTPETSALMYGSHRDSVNVVKCDDAKGITFLYPADPNPNESGDPQVCSANPNPAPSCCLNAGSYGTEYNQRCCDAFPGYYAISVTTVTCTGGGPPYPCPRITCDKCP